MKVNQKVILLASKYKMQYLRVCFLYQSVCKVNKPHIPYGKSL